MKKYALLAVLTLIACISQNIVPVHIAYIPILIPPILRIMNELKIDRRAAACCTAFGLEVPYIAIPFGFGLIFQTVIATNLSKNGMKVSVADVSAVNWYLGLAMFASLLFAVFVLYRKPREYKTTETDTRAADAVVGPLNKRHYVTILAIIAVSYTHLTLPTNREV